MKKYDLVKMSESICRVMSKNGITPKDADYLHLYDEYQRMKAEGRKFSYILYYLSEVSTLSETTIWRIIRRFDEDAEI